MSSNPLLPAPLRGIVPPLVTPLRDRDTLDAGGLERLLDHVVAGGVSGLFLLGTTGEGPSLSYRLRHELIDRACRHVAGRAPVLVGITDTSFTETLNMARRAAEAGAQAVVLAAPYYFPAGQPELLEYLEDLVPQLPLPLFLYNMPSLTKVSFGEEIVRRALDMEKIAGIKDSSGDMLYFHRLLNLTRQRSDWSVLIGPEELMAEAVLMGAHGGVNGGANLNPRLYVDLYHAAAARDIERVLALHAEVLKLSRGLYTVGRHSSAIIKGIKCALTLMGICEGGLAEPFHRFKETEQKIIADRLRELGLLR